MSRFIFSLVALTLVLGGCASADLKTAKHLKKEGRYEEARVHLNELAEFGISGAQLELARMYLRGQGVEKSPERAVPLLEAAAQKNDKKAFYELGRLYEKGAGVPQDGVRAAQYYDKAVQAGYANAAYNWAKMLEKGAVIRQDIPEAKRLYAYAAQNGYKRAILALEALELK